MPFVDRSCKRFASVPSALLLYALPAIARGETRPLLGLPLTVKESYNIAGLPTTWGFPPQKDFRPAEDALSITRVREAGGVSWMATSKVPKPDGLVWPQVTLSAVGSTPGAGNGGGGLRLP